MRTQRRYAVFESAAGTPVPASTGREGVGGVRHEVLALPLLSELAIDHQIRRARAKHRPVLERKVEPLFGAAVAARLVAIETGRLGEHAGRDQRAEQRPARNARRTRVRHDREREQPPVRGGLDDLMTVELERGRTDAPQTDGHRRRRRDCDNPTHGKQTWVRRRRVRRRSASGDN